MAYHNNYNDDWTVQWIVTIVFVLVAIFAWKKRNSRRKHEKELKMTENRTAKSKWFTERLTEFDTRGIGSDEVFDFACEICDTGKEAVGFCIWCEQYMCLKCCQHHEKIRFSENHVLKGKEDFSCSKMQISMFGRKIVPVSAEDIKNLFTILIDGKVDNFVLLVRDGMHLSTVSMSDPSKKLFAISKAKSCYHKNEDPEMMFFIEKNRCVMRFCSEHKSVINCFHNPNNYTSITKFNGGLAVANYIPSPYTVPSWSIQFLDFQGNIKNYLVYDADGRPLFKNIYSLKVDNTGTFLFVCDEMSCIVTVVGTNGELVRKIAFNIDVYPRELAFDSEGNIYLACAYQVIQVDALCKTFRVLFSLNANWNGNGITHICYNKSTNTMVIVENGRTLTTFSFLPEYCRKSSIHEFPSAKFHSDSRTNRVDS